MFIRKFDLDCNIERKLIEPNDFTRKTFAMCMPRVSTTKWSENRFASVTSVTKVTAKCATWHRNVHRMKIAHRIPSAMMAYAFVKMVSSGTFPISKMQFDSVSETENNFLITFPAAAYQAVSVAEHFVPRMPCANGTMFKAYHFACVRKDIPAMASQNVSACRHRAMFKTTAV